MKSQLTFMLKSNIEMDHHTAVIKVTAQGSCANSRMGATCSTMATRTPTASKLPEFATKKVSFDNSTIHIFQLNHEIQIYSILLFRTHILQKASREVYEAHFESAPKLKLLVPLFVEVECSQDWNTKRTHGVT